MPTAQDASRTCEFLAGSGLLGTACADIETVCRELAAGAGIVLLTDEAIGKGGAERLSGALGNQPAWSDVPLVVLTREGDGPNVSFRESANATLVERPVRMRTLLSVVRSGLRARRRQYEVRDSLAERQRTEEAIRVERERLRITLASIGDAVISTDAEGRVHFLNGVAEALTGWPQAEAAGQQLSNIFRIVNEHTRRLVENPAVRALQEGIIVGLANHTVLIARDGTERPIDDSAAPIRDGAGIPSGAVLVFRDVTERKRAEEAQARLAAIVESSDDAIISKTLDGSIRSWNAGAERLFGHKSSEAVGQSITLIIPPDRLEEERDILDRLRRGERVEHFETVRLAKDGRLLNVSLTISPIRDAEGRIIGASKIARDVTDRTRVEAALRRSEERYRSLFESMAEGFCLIEMLYDDDDRPIDYRFLEVNPAFEAHTGFKDAVGRTIRELVPDHDDHWFENYGRVAATGEPMRFLNEAKAMGRWYDVSAYRPGGPETRRVAILFTDITERKHAEEAIRQRDERIDLFLGNATDYAVIICDTEDRVVEWLGGAERITGWRADEVRGKPVDLIFTPQDRAAGVPAAETARAAETGRAENTRWHARKDGSRFFADGVAVALRGPTGELRGFGKVFRDATAQKLAQEELARDALLLASVRDSVVVTDPEGVVTYWNDGAARLFGWTAEEMMGRHYADRFSEPMRTFVVDQIRERTAGVEWCGEYQDHRKDGSHIWIDARVSTVTDAEGRVVGLLGVSHDITERKGAEDSLRDADRRKDEFIALLAHELRNPLAPIRNGLQVMRLGAGDANVVSQARTMMERQLGHMVRLIDDLLDVSRISRNKMELRRSRVSLADVVGSAAETARPLIDAGGHGLVIALPPEPIFLHADLTRLAQVFANLLSNSAKYTPPGGHIWLSAERRGEDAFISVRDDGIGIPAEALDSVFDMFSQVDRSIERSTGGLGIGLALVKGLVEMHNGTVAAESPGPGRGSTFTVRLPALERNTARESENSLAAELPTDGLKRRVLVVDDNRDSATSMAMMLRLVGNEVWSAHDGVEAVEAAEHFRPQVILMDVGMPKLNGYEATRRVRERPWGRSVTIIALTGWGQEGDRAQSREAGCDGHLVKPVSLPDLEKLLVELVSENSGCR